MKIMRIKNNITVILKDGTMLTNSKCTDEMHEDILNNVENEELVKDILMPEYSKTKEEIQTKMDMLDNFSKSEYLTVSGSSVYVKSISELSLPEDLAMAIWKAEQADNIELLSTYLNFWTLCSLNPDSRARTNLFWFLNRYGMTISSSGLFVAYRNVVLKKEGSDINSKWAKFITDSFTKVRFQLKQSPKNYYIGKDANGERICTTSEKKIVKLKGMLSDLYEKLSDENVAPVYTDGYTGKFTIRIGEPVTMDRSKCDSKQENTCSRGLHVAGKSWLQSNYFGNVGLRVLVNPADVVAVPPQDSYGKMRTCAYYPIAVVAFDSSGNIIDEEIEDGFEDNFIDMISYVGEVNKEDLSSYTINIPTIPEISRNKIVDRLDDIKESLRIKNMTHDS